MSLFKPFKEKRKYREIIKSAGLTFSLECLWVACLLYRLCHSEGWGLKKNFWYLRKWWVFVIVSTHLWVKQVKKKSLGVKEKYVDLWSYWNWFFFCLFFKYTRLKTWRNSEKWLLSPSSLLYQTTYRPEGMLLSDLWWGSWCRLQNCREIPCFYMECWGKGGDGSREGVHTRRKKLNKYFICSYSRIKTFVPCGAQANLQNFYKDPLNLKISNPWGLWVTHFFGGGHTFIRSYYNLYN